VRIRCASGPLWEIHERGLDLAGVRRLMFVDRVTTCAHCSVHVPDVLLLGGSMAWEVRPPPRPPAATPHRLPPAPLPLLTRA
jgi:hypothetical protein